MSVAAVSPLHLKASPVRVEQATHALLALAYHPLAQEEHSVLDSELFQVQLPKIQFSSHASHTEPSLFLTYSTPLTYGVV